MEEVGKEKEEWSSRVTKVAWVSLKAPQQEEGWQERRGKRWDR